MKTTQCCLLFLAAMFFWSHCGKKTGSKEHVRQQNEEMAISTAVPMVDWIKTLVVQPFRKPPSTPGDYATIFKELTDCTMRQLACARELKVLLPSSWNLTQTEKQTSDYMLTCDSEIRENSITLTCHLVDLRKGTHLWQKTFDTDLHSMFGMAKCISDSVLIQLNMNTSTPGFYAAGNVPDDILNLYMEGKRYYDKNNRLAADLAVQNFKKTLRADSTFVPAWLALGETYLQIYNSGWDRNMVWFHLSQQTAFKVLQMDSTCADARRMLGQVYFGLGDMMKAEEQFRKAIAFNSSLKEAWFGLGNVLSEYGLYLPSLAVFSRALELDPKMLNASIGKALVLTGLKHYSEAEQELDQALALQPNASDLHTYIALVRCYQNDLTGAQVEIKKGFQDGETSPFSHVVQAMVFARQEKLDQALGELELKVIPFLHNDTGLCVAVSAVYALINRPGLAVQWLERAVEFGYRQYPWLENDPNFKSMRNDERFVQVLKSVRKEWEKRALGSK